jgi:hypothetical protein
VLADSKENICKVDVCEQPAGLGLPFAQMFAYGHKYVPHTGELVLIYPKDPGFTAPLPPFYYQDGLRLWVVPVCVESGGLVEGNRCVKLSGIRSQYWLAS